MQRSSSSSAGISPNCGGSSTACFCSIGAIYVEHASWPSERVMPLAAVDPAEVPYFAAVLVRRRSGRMIAPVPPGAAVVVLGPGGGALGRRVCDLLPGAQLFGPRAHPGDWDDIYDRALPLLADLFAAGRPIVGLCASGILIRAAGAAARRQARRAAGGGGRRGRLGRGAAAGRPSRRQRPCPRRSPRRCRSRLRRGDHHRRRPAARLRARRAAAGLAHRQSGADQAGRRGAAAPASRWRCRGRPAAADWLRAGTVHWADGSATRADASLTEPGRSTSRIPEALVFHPPVLALGIGCERCCSGRRDRRPGARQPRRGRAGARARSRQSSRSS